MERIWTAPQRKLRQAKMRTITESARIELFICFTAKKLVFSAKYQNLGKLLRTPHHQLSSLNPLLASHVEMLPLIDEFLMDRANQQGDALLGTGITEVVTGHANGTRA